MIVREHPGALNGRLIKYPYLNYKNRVQRASWNEHFLLMSDTKNAIDSLCYPIISQHNFLPDRTSPTLYGFKLGNFSLVIINN